MSGSERRRHLLEHMIGHVFKTTTEVVLSERAEGEFRGNVIDVPPSYATIVVLVL